MAPENMTVNDALWRIAELASRSSDPSWRGDRTRAMHDLEAAISEVGTRLTDCSAGLEEVRAAAVEAGAQARAARGERDREHARANHWEAKATEALEALAACQAQLATYQAQVETAAADRQDDLRTLRRAHHELTVARAALAGAESERDEARSALAAAQTALAAARSAQATARAETEMAEARRLAAEKARRAAEIERDAAVGVLQRHPQPVDVEVDIRTPAETAADQADAAFQREAPAAPEAPRPLGKPRLIHVAATLGHLLPDDLGGLLVPGAHVVRREGRLAALVAIPATGSPWTQNVAELEERQADLLRTEGFRVEWSESDRLAS